MEKLKEYQLLKINILDILKGKYLLRLLINFSYCYIEFEKQEDVENAILLTDSVLEGR